MGAKHKDKQRRARRWARLHQQALRAITARDLSHRQIASACQVSHSHISGILSVEQLSIPTDALIERIIEFLELDEEAT